jgi:hypothetical protein
MGRDGSTPGTSLGVASGSFDIVSNHFEVL